MNPDLHTIATAAKIAATILFVLAVGFLCAAYAVLQELRSIAQSEKTLLTCLDWRTSKEVER